MNSNFFQIIYDKKDESFALTLMDKADKTYEDMLSKFGFSDVLGNQKIILTICESVAKYIEVTNKTTEEYQEWMVGNCDYKNRKITILSPRISTTHTIEELVQVFVHETIHLIFDIYAGNLTAPIWCAEGIAILFSNQVPLNYISESDYPKITELLDEETFPENGGYEYAGVYVWYFIQKYGFTKFLDLYKNRLDVTSYIYEGFEQEAIIKIKEHVSG